jgi:hypothetical protein
MDGYFLTITDVIRWPTEFSDSRPTSNLRGAGIT